MAKAQVRNKIERQCLAVALCFAATVLLSLQALNPKACAWMGFDRGQAYTFDALLATACAFLGAFILAQIAAGQPSDK